MKVVFNRGFLICVLLGIVVIVLPAQQEQSESNGLETSLADGYMDLRDNLIDYLEAHPPADDTAYAKVFLDASFGLLNEAGASQYDIRPIIDGEGMIPGWYRDLDEDAQNYVRAFAMMFRMMQAGNEDLGRRLEQARQENIRFAQSILDDIGKARDDLGESADAIADASKIVLQNLDSAGDAVATMNDIVTSYRNIIDMQNEALRRSRAQIGLPVIAVSLLPGWQISDSFRSGILVPGMQLQMLFPGWGLGIGAVSGRALEESIVFVSVTLPLGRRGAGASR